MKIMGKIVKFKYFGDLHIAVSTDKIIKMAKSQFTTFQTKI